ncbi:MAG: hypothetical protein V1757_01730, partial [Actinomycetota bacterium]
MATAPKDEQQGARQQHDLALQAQARPALPDDGIVHDGEPQAAEDDEGADDSQDQPVVGKRGEALKAPGEVEAGVVEGRDRVEQAPPGCIEGTVRIAAHEEGRREDRRANPLGG